MAHAPVLPLWTDALIGDTVHLSMQEFGAYVMILIAIWRHDARPLPDDDKKFAQMLRVSPKIWARNLRPALEPFFVLENHAWRQLRLEKEWERLQRVLEQKRFA